MARETTLSFEEYFWQDVDLDGKVVLDAETGFGLTTSEVAGRLSQQKHKGRIISLDIDSEAFEDARKLLLTQGLLDLVTFVKTDLSNMPEIASNSIDIVISTRTIADINSFPCRLTRALVEFQSSEAKRSSHSKRRISTSNSFKSTRRSCCSEVAACKSHIPPNSKTTRQRNRTRRPRIHNEARRIPRMQMGSFQRRIKPQRRMSHFVERATEMIEKIKDSKLKNAFREQIKNIRTMFTEQGGTFLPRYILHAKK